MNERCPLSSRSVPGFYYQEEIPETCIATCEALWEAAVKSGLQNHEEYPAFLINNPDCPHSSTEYGNSSLQATAIDSPVRHYGITERCTSCSDEIAEDSYIFVCPKP